MIRARGLHFARGANVIYDGVDIDIPRGKVVGIMGPSGTGKTTLLRLIGAQWRPRRGTIEFDGLNLHRIPRRKLYVARRRMGMLFQNGALLTDLNVFENVAFPLREQTKLPEELIRTIVLMKLEAVGLRGASRLYPSELSGGMGRRVALARGIAMDPALMMYDEPFAGQDPVTMGVLMRLVRQLNDGLGMTSIVVSHDIEELLSIADYGYVIARGKVQARGTPDEIRSTPSEWVQRFLSGTPDDTAMQRCQSARPLAEELLEADT